MKIGRLVVKWYGWRDWWFAYEYWEHHYRLYNWHLAIGPISIWRLAKGQHG